MELKELISGMPITRMKGADGISIQGITHFSQEVRKEFLFAALPGVKTNGHLFIQDALDRGASAIICEKMPTFSKNMEPAATWIQVENSRRSFAQVACRYHGDPSMSMGIIGVTGTNGKTTTSFLIRQLLEAKGVVGLIGTVGNWIGRMKQPSTHTTPESSDLQRLFHQMKDAGIQNVVMEVSSHSLAMDRVAGTSFDTVIFTNLTQDHLEYHQNMENYFQAKSKLFTDLFPTGSKAIKPVAIINLDDPWGERLKDLSVREVWTYGLNSQSDLQGTDIRKTATGTSLQIQTPVGKLKIHSPLLGTFNVYNLLAAVGAAIHHSIPLNVIEETLSKPIQVPGRLEKIPGEYPFTVLVDYAHTDDALLNVLKTIHEIKEGRILLVFGCGGDRDKGKRPKMGLVAGRLADLLFLTSDNPRGEDPVSILNDVEKGVILSGSKKYQLIVNRREAIECAIQEARPGDVVLLAGKGHEDYQMIGSVRLSFSDLEVAKDVLKERFGF